MKKTTAAVLILSGSTLGHAQVYIPQQKAKPTQEIVQMYISGNRYDANKSEQRKKELLKDIAGIRKQIRNMAEVYRRDHNTVLSGVTAQQKVHIHAEKLMSKIAREIA